MLPPAHSDAQCKQFHLNYLPLSDRWFPMTAYFLCQVICTAFLSPQTTFLPTYLPFSIILLVSHCVPPFFFYDRCLQTLSVWSAITTLLYISFNKIMKLIKSRCCPDAEECADDVRHLIYYN